MKYYKVLSEDLKHYNMQYHEGLNVNCEKTYYNGNCKHGLFFSDAEHILEFCNYGTKIAEVEIPDGERIDICGIKYKAHRIILKNIRDLWTVETFQELVSEGAKLENRDISYSGTAGVRFRRSIKTFRGYLPSEDSVGRTIEEDKIKVLLDASDSVRNRLLILLLAETGFRIGEILGIRYAQDIDYEKRTIKVAFREDNENQARAKNAEIRRAKVSEETFEILLHYISENRKLLNKTKYLFVNMYGENKGKPLTANAVYSALSVLERRTGIEITPHMLRHYFANERRN